MKSIIEYIFENINDKAKSLIDYINDKVKENDDDSINRLYSSFKKDEVKPIIKQWLTLKMENDSNKQHREDFKASVYGLCDELGCWNEIYDLAQKQINNEEKSYFNIDFKKFNINNIYEHYNELNIPLKFWKKLMTKGSSNKPVIGSGEFLLRLISKNPGDKKIGDVIINDTGVEVKYLYNAEGKIGNESLGNTESIYNFLNDIIDKYNLNINKINLSTISINPNKSKIKENWENIQNLLKIISSSNKIEDDFLINSLKNNLKISFPVDIDDDIIYKVIEKLKNKSITSKEFIKIFTILFIYLYCKKENSEYLCIIDTENNFNFVHIDKNIFDIYNDDSFPFYQIRYDNTCKMINIKYPKVKAREENA